ncbi:MAG: hypothetical protein IPO58_12470 [Betaproteobacteria bacterium]|nr:hypothetical protein [Betaproteobacteria bacterium]
MVENKAGAATTIGADFVAKSPADGYTILLAPAPFVITQYAYPKLPYDSRRDFTPVTLLVTNPMVVTVNASVPAKNFAEFVALMKAQPGKLNYGSPGNGSLPHVATEMFKQRAGLDAVHIPYKGGGPAVIDLVGGQISFMFASPEVMQHVKTGKLRVLAATASTAPPVVLARGADGDRERLSRLRSAGLVRRGRAGRDAARHRRQARHRDQRDPGPRRKSSAVSSTASTRAGRWP